MPMLAALEIVTVLIVAIAMAMALAHALELPGKLRLSKEEYLIVQPIYYPGFTFGGATEPLGTILVFVLVLLAPVFGTRYWLLSGAFLALLAMHAIYWLVTHPVNNVWLTKEETKGAGTVFFASGPQGDERQDWRVLRDRWERSHLLRAVLGLVALILLVTAVAL
jgi:hypothetical protein